MMCGVRPPWLVGHSNSIGSLRRVNCEHFRTFHMSRIRTYLDIKTSVMCKFENMSCFK